MRKVKLHIRTFALKMPPVGLEPVTSTYEAHTIAQLTKWAGRNGNSIFTDLKPIFRLSVIERAQVLLPQNRTIRCPAKRSPFWGPFPALLQGSLILPIIQETRSRD